MVVCALALLAPAAAQAASGSSSEREGAREGEAARKNVTFAVEAQAGRCHVLTLFCALSRSTIRLGRGPTAAQAQKVVRSLNTRLEDKPMPCIPCERRGRGG